MHHCGQNIARLIFILIVLKLVNSLPFWFYKAMTWYGQLFVHRWDNVVCCFTHDMHLVSNSLNACLAQVVSYHFLVLCAVVCIMSFCPCDLLTYRHPKPMFQGWYMPPTVALASRACDGLWLYHCGQGRDGSPSSLDVHKVGTGASHTFYLTLVPCCLGGGEWAREWGLSPYQGRGKIRHEIPNGEPEGPELTLFTGASALNLTLSKSLTWTWYVCWQKWDDVFAVELASCHPEAKAGISMSALEVVNLFVHGWEFVAKSASIQVLSDDESHT